MTANRNALTPVLGVLALAGHPAAAEETAAPAAVTLPEVTVEASGQTPPATDGYTAYSATTATKTDTPLADVPFSVQVITQEVLDDRQAYRLQDVLSSASNLQSVSTSISYEQLQSRGFTIDPYLDGFKTYFIVLPLANAERVEVLKGPGAALYGRVEPGGLLNVITRKPAFTSSGMLEQQFGSYNFARTSGDFTGPLGDGEALAYRFDFEYQDRDTFRDFEGYQRVFANPSLRWQASDATTVDLSLYYRTDTQRNTAFGIPALGDRPARVPLSRNYGEPGFDNTFEVRSATFGVEHELDESWKLRLNAATWLGDYDYGLLGYGGLQEDGRTLDRYYLVSDNDHRDTRNASLDLVGKIGQGDLRHTVLAGLEYSYFDEVSDWFGDNAGKYPAPTIDIFNPVYGQVASYATLLREKPDAYFLRRETSSAINVQDQIAWGDDWRFLIGGRYDSASAGTGFDDASFANASADLSRNKNRVDRFSPRAGVVYKVAPGMSLYTSFAESFGSNNGGRSRSDTPFPPETARQYEVGAKAEWLDGRLSSTVAVFDLTKRNVLTTDPADPNFSVAIGEANSQGFEVDLLGKLDERNEVIANYAYTDARVTSGDSAGLTLPNAPRQALNLLLSHRYGEAWRFGGGGRFVSQREGELSSPGFQLPGYAIFDAFAAYSFRWNGTALTAQLNANNLLDTDYYAASAGYRADILAGEPRTLMASVRAEF